ncbi:hypothetical protein Q0Z83_052820 [Actinoplanes sichuanensis]|nr:hypothetical protein Q0Z83_052820 [Actinoplanes sichuanensis]
MDEVIDQPLRVQWESFLEEHRTALHDSLDGLTEEQARRRLVSSETTLLGLVKHMTFVERVWFDEAITGRPRSEIGIPDTPHESFALDESDTIAGVQAAYREACEASRAAVANLHLDDIVTGNRRGPVPLRWVYLHFLREIAQHCGHADILREQILAQPADRWARSDWWGVVLDGPDIDALATFYAELRGWSIWRRDPGHIVLDAGEGVGYLAVQENPDFVRPAWPTESSRQQMMSHLDFEVTDLEAAVAHAVGLGAELPAHQPQKNVRVLLDPAGHPFCLYSA